MKKIILILVGIIALLNYSYAQTLAARITNARVEGDQFRWDVEINRTDDWGSGGGNDILGNCDFYFYVNVNGFTAGNPTVSNIHSSLDGNGNYSFDTGRAGSGSQCYIALTYDNYGGGTDWYPPLNSWELLYTATLTIADANENSGLAWHETSTGFSRGNNQPLTATLSIDGEADISLADPSGILSNGYIVIPEKFKLYQNYPNPFNPSTRIVFDIPLLDVRDLKVSINIYNSMGKLVRHLFSGVASVGQTQLFWNGKSDQGIRVSSGIYYAKLVSTKFSHTIKMTLIK